MALEIHIPGQVHTLNEWFTLSHTGNVFYCSWQAIPILMTRLQKSTFEHSHQCDVPITCPRVVSCGLTEKNLEQSTSTKTKIILCVNKILVESSFLETCKARVRTHRSKLSFGRRWLRNSCTNIKISNQSSTMSARSCRGQLNLV